MKRSILGVAALTAPVALGLMVVYGATNPAASADQLAFGYGMGPGGGQGMWADGNPNWGPGMGRGGRGGRMGRPDSWPGASRVDADHDGTITVDEVKTFVEARHLQRGFEQFTIGDVVEKDENKITVQILDADGDKVRVLTFPRTVDTAAVNTRGRPGYGKRGGRGGPRHGMQRGYDMRSGGFGPGMQGGYADPGFRKGMGYGLQADGTITVDEVKGLLERRLTMWKNPNLKVGEVTETDDNIITAEIVTKDGSLVQSMKFDRKTGRPLWNR